MSNTNKPVSLTVMTYNTLPTSMRRTVEDGSKECFYNGAWHPVKFVKVNLVKRNSK